MLVICKMFRFSLILFNLCFVQKLKTTKLLLILIPTKVSNILLQKKKMFNSFRPNMNHSLFCYTTNLLKLIDVENILNTLTLHTSTKKKTTYRIYISNLNSLRNLKYVLYVQYSNPTHLETDYYIIIVYSITYNLMNHFCKNFYFYIKFMYEV